MAVSRYRFHPSNEGIALAVLAILCAVVGIERTFGEETRVPFTRMVIDADPPDRPWYKMVGDVDGDGDLDVVVGGAKGPLVWYAYPSWRRTQIAEGGWDGVRGAIADIDGDGDGDIVMGGVVWFSNPRIGGGAWTMVRIDHQKAHDVEVADVDLDGRLDIVARDQSAFGKAGNSVYVYRQDDPRSWKKHTIPCPHGEGLKLGDVDRDGDPDILIGGQWFENARGAAADRWEEHVYTRSWTEPDVKVELADINGDSRVDVVLTPAELRGETYKLAWYEAPEDPRRDHWAEHVIAPSAESVIHSLGVGDLDHDGRIDIVIAEMHQGADPDEVCIYLNRERGAAWRKQVLSARGSHDVVLADIGGDGDLDIVGANHGGPFYALELWRNDVSAVTK